MSTAAVSAHHPEVVRQGQHCPGAECVADHSGCGGDGQGEYPGQHALDASDIPLGLLPVGRQPIQIQAVGVELPGRGSHQGAVSLCAVDLIEGGVDLGDPVGVKAVLAIPEVEDEDVVLAIKRGHRKPLHARAIEVQATTAAIVTNQ